MKKAKCQINAYKLWCWRRLLRVPCTAKRSNQSILKEVNSEYSVEGLKLKLQYFVYLIWRASLLEKTLMLGKIEGKRRKGRQRMRCWDSITDSLDMSLSKFWDILEDKGAWYAAVHGVAKSWTKQQLNNNKHLSPSTHCACVLSHFSHVWLFVTLWTIAFQRAPLSLGFSRKEYWSGLHALLQGIFPSQGSNLPLLHLLIGRWVLYH